MATKVTVEISKFESSTYDFKNDKGESISGTKFIGKTPNGGQFKFKNEEEMKKIMGAEEGALVSFDKYGRLFLKEE